MPTCTAAALAALAAVLATVCAGDRADALNVLSVHVVPDVRLNHGVALGGLSDLSLAPAGAATEGLIVWAITDRGPNGMVGEGEAKRRTLLVPDFVPALVKLRLPADGGAAVEAVLPLTGGSGKPLSGRPNGVGRDEPVLDGAGRAAIAADPDGVDTEGLVVMPDGSFWVTEEYRPSLMRVSAEGRVLERHVPAGVELTGADTTVITDIPAAYGDRRDNRGFEGLALSADAKHLFVLLQSPLDHPQKKAASKTGNVRLLVCDAATGRPVAEHVYRLGDPTAAGWAEHGAPPDDGKLCCLAAMGDGTLLVLEQDDTGLARLYLADPRAATDTLPRTTQAEGEPLETIRDLAAAGIEPLGKTLVADLGSLVSRLRRDVSGSGSGASLKLEGLAVLDDRRVLLCNDNDFAVPSSAASGGDGTARSCLWVIGLPTPLTTPASLTAGR
ncbi:MAG: esterase-like activity of phytase family protein [Planctomycetia bacterium]